MKAENPWSLSQQEVSFVNPGGGVPEQVRHVQTGRPNLTKSEAREKAATLHGTKAAVYEAVRRRPGRIVRQVATAVGTSYQNTDRHIKDLYEMGLLARVKTGSAVHYYCVEDSKPYQFLEPYLEDAKKRKVIEHLERHPNKQWIINQLAKEVGLYHTFINRLVLELGDLGVVRVAVLKPHCYVKAKPKLANLLEERRKDLERTRCENDLNESGTQTSTQTTEPTVT